MMTSFGGVVRILAAGAGLFIQAGNPVAQDLLDHVDMSSPEMTESELTRDELLSLLASASSGQPVDLRSKRLSGLNLQRVDFKAANLRWARLNNADLRGANLAGAILDSAWLVGANLEGANLQRANLASTQMQSANLKNADLSSARIVANLQRADLSDADLSYADMGADMKNQSMGLMRTVLRMASLDGADLRNVNALRMDAGFASMRGASLDNAVFHGVDLTGADLTHASVAGLDLSGSDVSGAYLIGLTGKELLIGLDRVKNLREAHTD